MDQPHKFQFATSAPVHVWSADLDVTPEELNRLSALLNVQEAVRARRFHFEHDRRRYTAARAFLRCLLGNYLGCPPEVIEFGYAARGKPFVQTPVGRSIQFNVSHSYGRALFGVAEGRELGIDLEVGTRLGDDWPGLVRRIFSPREREELFSLPAEHQRAAFLNGWTRKEAYLKATGQGLVDGLQSIEVTLDPEQPAGWITTPASERHWSIHDLRHEAGHAAALVVEGEIPGYASYECPSCAK